MILLKKNLLNSMVNIFQHRNKEIKMKINSILMLVKKVNKSRKPKKFYYMKKFDKR